ncbi:hypothetical protein UT300003_24040 [Clostridium sardiniense]
MKKIISIALPSLLILSLIFIDQLNPFSKYILVGLFFIFPIAFIIQGILCKNSKNNLIVGLVLASMCIILPINIFYNMSGVLPLIVVYIGIGTLSFHLSNRIKGKSILKSN